MRDRGANFPPGKLNVKTGTPLYLNFGFSVVLVFIWLLFLRLSDYFPVV